MKPFRIYALAAIVIAFSGMSLFSQTAREIDLQAEEYFDNKEFNKSVALWLEILDREPDNEKIQQKIERVYEIKQSKDMAFQRAKLNYRLARKKLIDVEEDEILEEGITRGKDSLKNYFTAYRLDPKDLETREFLGNMKNLQRDIELAEEKLRLSRKIRERILLLRELANGEMKQELFNDALARWDEILDYLPEDKEALEGKRKCVLAIENRIKFEKIQSFTAKGQELFDTKQYKLARLEYEQVLQIDPKNRDAENMIENIDEIIEEKTLYEQRRRQAEEFYLAALNDIENNRFDSAKENFENALAAIKNYRDAKERLAQVEIQRRQYEERVRQRKLEEINRLFQEGMLAYSDQKYDDAINFFVRTLELDEKNELAKNYLKRARDAQQQIQEQAVDENSPYYNIVNALTISGKDLYNKGLYLASKKKWDQILKLFPKNRIANEYITLCDIRLDPSGAKMIAEKRLKEGKEFLRNRNYRAALSMFEIVQSIDKNYPGMAGLIEQANQGLRLGGAEPVEAADRAEINRRYQLAMTYFQRGGRENIMRALNEFRWVVQKDPNNVRAVISVNKIEAQLRIGNAQIYQAAQQRLTPQQQELVNRYYYQGIQFYTTNQFQKAIQEWNKVLAIDPGHVKARNNIRKVLAFIGR